MTSNKNGLALIHSGINVKLHAQVAPRIHVLDMADAAMASTEKEPASVTHNTMVFIVSHHVTVVTASATTAQTELVHAHVLLPTPSVQIVPFHGQPLSLVLSVQL